MKTETEFLAIAETTRLAVAHCAKAILELHSETATAYGKDFSIAEIALPRDIEILASMLKHLDEAGALMEEDVWTIQTLDHALKILKVVEKESEQP